MLNGNKKYEYRHRPEYIILYLHNNTPMWVKQIQIQTKHRKHRKLQFDHNIGYTK